MKGQGKETYIGEIFLSQGYQETRMSTTWRRNWILLSVCKGINKNGIKTRISDIIRKTFHNINVCIDYTRLSVVWKIKAIRIWDRMKLNSFFSAKKTDN